jgi:hypothetical protein
MGVEDDVMHDWIMLHAAARAVFYMDETEVTNSCI